MRVMVVEIDDKTGKLIKHVEERFYPEEGKQDEDICVVCGRKDYPIANRGVPISGEIGIDPPILFLSERTLQGRIPVVSR